MPRRTAVRRIHVSEMDRAAAQRLLSAIAQTGEEDVASTASARREALEEARLALSVRQRRLRMFDGGLSADAPFTLMLALYANEEYEPQVTLSG